MEKTKVIIEKGVMLLTYKGEVIPHQIDMTLKDDCQDSITTAIVTFHVDVDDTEIGLQNKIEDLKDMQSKHILLRTENYRLKKELEEVNCLVDKQSELIKKAIKKESKSWFFNWF